MAHGFGTPKSVLYKNWLIPEGRQGVKGDFINIHNLYTSLSLLVGNACCRTTNGDSNAHQAAITIILTLDKERFDQIKEKPWSVTYWLDKLNTNEEFYISYIKFLANIVKERVFAGEVDDVNGLFKESDEYKQWLLEAGYAVAKVELISGIFHPLSEIHGRKDGFPEDDMLNLWAAASIMAAIACGRELEGENPQKVISRLLSEGVLKFENYQTQLEICKVLDSAYISLINDIHAMFESKKPV